MATFREWWSFIVSVIVTVLGVMVTAAALAYLFLG